MLTSEMHRYLDYLTVIIFCLGPLLFTFSGVGILLAYTLAVIHLIMTVLTAFPGGRFSIISFSLHGYVELFVGLLLVMLPWLLDNTFFPDGQLFFSVMGFIILIIWFLTSYKHPLGAQD